MYLKKLIPLIILLFIWQLAIPQIPPANPHLIDSPFPLVHRNNYRQGYSDLPALFGRDSIRVRTLLTPNDRVSPWLQLSEVYPDGSRTLWGSTSTHIWKAYSTPDSFFLVDAYQIDFNPAINDLSWAFLQLGNHQVLTYDDNRLLKFADQNPNDPLSPILLVEEDSVPAGIGTPAKLTRLYDGSIAFASDIGVIGLIDDNLNLLDTLRLPLAADETAFHNDFASDEKGGIYTITSKKMMRLQVTNQQLFVDWQVPRDFGGNNIQGVGTTPTLLGNESDRLVCVVDSKQPANLLSFWRDSIPADWTGLPGEDIRIAAVTPLPNSGPISPLYTAVENSPVAYGYGIACAQYNGLLGQSCQTAKGVYKMEWDTLNNRMELMWHRQDINLNNVLAYSRPDNLIYGSGREDDCLYYYYGLDWQTGETELKVPLGAQPYFDDPGNANVILDDGSIVYNSKERLIQVQPVARPLGLAQENDPIQLRVFPNPSQGILKLEWEDFSFQKGKIEVLNLIGQGLLTKDITRRNGASMDVSLLPPGMYFIRIQLDDQSWSERFVIE